MRNHWIKDGSPQVGLIAQEVEEVFPVMVITDPKAGLKPAKYQSLVAPLIEATKQLHELCAAGQSQLADLERSVARLRRTTRKCILIYDRSRNKTNR